MGEAGVEREWLIIYRTFVLNVLPSSRLKPQVEHLKVALDSVITWFHAGCNFHPLGERQNLANPEMTRI
jgi:hypothetical protein